MACFLVTHQVSGDFSQAEWLANEKKVIGHLPREIKWVMSWFLPEQNCMLTHWDAPTEQAVRVTLERSGICHTLPILKIEPAVELYPKRYVARRNAAHKKQTPKHKHPSHPTHEMSGAYAESISSTLQARAAAHLKPVPPSTN